MHLVNEIDSLKYLSKQKIIQIGWYHYLVKFAGLKQSQTLVLNPDNNIQVEQFFCINSTFDGTTY